MKTSDNLINENLEIVKACLDQAEQAANTELVDRTWPAINALRSAIESQDRIIRHLVAVLANHDFLTEINKARRMVDSAAKHPVKNALSLKTSTMTP
jgi:hypothetical protein